MLPEIRSDEHLFSVPKFDINKEDIQEFDNELRAFHENFRDCFARSESREHFYNYMAGQFSTLERKSIEPIALAIENGNVRPMQHFVSKVVWDDERILYKYHNMINEDLGDPDGVLIFDETGYQKRGMTPLALENSTVALSEKSKIAKLAFSQHMHHPMATP
ncbi:MAG: transposase [Deltaproteobacteria bacterium]|nr:transposase [Deltaproteobacteria bacterium]